MHLNLPQRAYGGNIIMESPSLWCIETHDYYKIVLILISQYKIDRYKFAEKQIDGFLYVRV